MKTIYSSPKKNIISGMLDLRSALAYGCKAKLVRARNEDCSHPILKLKKVQDQDQDFRNYEFSYGTSSSINKIKNSTSSDFEKNLSLNYVSCFGTEEAVKRYYETGKVTADNSKGMGRSHLVRVDDLIAFYEKTGEYQRAEMYRRQYRAPEHVNDVVHFFDFYRYKHGSPYAIEKFKHKLWVVELLNAEEKQPRIPLMVHVLNFLAYPLKYIPQRSVLRMPDYTNYTYRVGGVTNGYSVEFQVPKKFSFNNK